MNLVELNLEKIKKLCDNHRVSKLFVFGSVLRDTFNDESDVDLIVDFDDVDLNQYADNYFDLKQKLEDVFNRSVDLLEEKAIRNPYLRKEIEREKRLIYG